LQNKQKRSEIMYRQVYLAMPRRLMANFGKKRFITTSSIKASPWLHFFGSFFSTLVIQPCLLVKKSFRNHKWR
uniref:Ovule protein n=1 Tax=Haemonchus placei TaxID=6290 RepID=A0A0N4WFD3_HAEPC